jgi:hypothetical protein
VERREGEGEVEGRGRKGQAGSDPTWELKMALASARKRESKLLRRLGRIALEYISRGEPLSPEDGYVSLLVDDLRRVSKEIHCLVEKLKQATLSPYSEKASYPPPPGSDTHFPFSR